MAVIFAVLVGFAYAAYVLSGYWLTRFARPSGQPAAVISLRCVSQRFHSAS